MIVCLGAIIVWLVVQKPDSSELQEFFNFAAAVASLFLAVVAIFYSMISTQDQTALLQTTQDAANRVGIATENLKEMSNNVGNLLQNLSGNLELIPEEIRNVKTSLSERFDDLSSQTSSMVPGEIRKLDKFSNGQASVGTVLSLHMLSKARKAGRVIDSKSLSETNRYFAGVFMGFCNSIHFFEPCNIKLEIAGQNVSVSDLGDLDPAPFTNISMEQVPTSSRDILIEFYKQMQLDPPNFENKPDIESSDDAEQVA
jgi:hypothetical protein